MSAQGAGNAQKKRNREAANWILRNRDPNQSPSDKARFQEWLDRDPENRRTYTAAERLLDDASRAIQSDSVLSDIKVRPRSLVKPVIATLMVLALATGSFFALDGPMRLQADVIAGTGEMRTISLEDGSEVQLNSSSAIAVDFTDSHRTIRLLQGQAFFRSLTTPNDTSRLLRGRPRLPHSARHSLFATAMTTLKWPSTKMRSRSTSTEAAQALSASVKESKQSMTTRKGKWPSRRSIVSSHLLGGAARSSSTIHRFPTLSRR